MIGTFLNVITVLVGGTLGCLFGSKLPDRLRQTIVVGLGLFTLMLGVQMFSKAQNILVVLGSLLVGALLGEWLGIEEKVNGVGIWLEKKTINSGTDTSQARFIHGYLTASLLFCVGPMAILGSIQDGLTGDYSLLAVKSTLDGFAALAFASSLGVGVLFSSVTVLVFQGGLSLLAGQAQVYFTQAAVNEMSAVGGVIIAGIAIGSLMELRPIRIGNFLPALLVVLVAVNLLTQIGIY